MSAPKADMRIAIVGANSPRGKELKDVLDEKPFSSHKISLFDEDIAVGTLTSVGDEPAIIAAVDEGSFEGTALVFFAGSAQMAARHANQARRAGARVIDLSEDPGFEEAAPWIPMLDPFLGRPAEMAKGLARSPSAAVILGASVTAALQRFSPARLVMVFFRPVSERGQEGIDELERQTVSLLSFRPISDEVFGAQVAFNLMDAYGLAKEPSLDAVRRSVARDIGRVLDGRFPLPAIQVLQAPVFYSYAFTAYADLPSAAETGEIEDALAAAGLRIGPADEPRPTNMSVAGKAYAALGGVARDPGHATGYWLWGAADNVRLVAANAVAIGEALL